MAAVPGSRSCRLSTASVDRLDQVPERLRAHLRVRRGAARSRAQRSRAEFDGDGRTRGRARRSPRISPSLRAARTASCSAPRRSACARRTGQKGRALFHPIRVALTGERRWPRAGPAGAGDRPRRRAAGRRAGLAPIIGCRERAAAFALPWVRRAALGSATSWASSPETVRHTPLIIYGLNPVLEALNAGRVTRCGSAPGR